MVEQRGQLAHGDVLVAVHSVHGKAALLSQRFQEQGEHRILRLERRARIRPVQQLRALAVLARVKGGACWRTASRGAFLRGLLAPLDPLGAIRFEAPYLLGGQREAHRAGAHERRLHDGERHGEVERYLQRAVVGIAHLAAPAHVLQERSYLVELGKQA